MQLVDEQRRALECELHDEVPMKFQTSSSTLKLLVDKEHAQEQGWMVSLVSRRVCVLNLINTPIKHNLSAGWHKIKA